MRKLLLWLCCLLCVACSPGKPVDENRFTATDLSGAAFGGKFRLEDHNGRVRQLEDFRGKLVALFFGYTHCPDVCPTTMDDLAKALKLMGDRRKDVQVLFVTLDPERDTRQVLAQYVPGFDPDFLGLYGDAATTAATAASFKVFYQKQVSGSKGGYTIDHSAGVYVFDKTGALRLFMNHGQKPQEMAQDLKQLL